MVQQQIIFRNLVYSYDDTVGNKLVFHLYHGLDCDLWPQEIYQIYRYVLIETRLCTDKSTTSEES